VVRGKVYLELILWYQELSHFVMGIMWAEMTWARSRPGVMIGRILRRVSPGFFTVVDGGLANSFRQRKRQNA